MLKNLIIVAAGDQSLHLEWIDNTKNFDLFVIYYGDSDEKFNLYSKNSKLSIKDKGEKWHLIHNFVTKNETLISNYNYIWFPDDDLKTTTKSINQLFEINEKYDLWLSQPSIDLYISHEIVKKVEDSFLRYTNFVEIICPIMNKEIVFKLLPTFVINKSGWGLDFLWPKLLEYPENRIAIIDEITVIHTKPNASYAPERFVKSPTEEMYELFSEYKVWWTQDVLLTIKKS